MCFNHNRFGDRWSDLGTCLANGLHSFISDFLAKDSARIAQISRFFHLHGRTEQLIYYLILRPPVPKSALWHGVKLFLRTADLRPYMVHLLARLLARNGTRILLCFNHTPITCPKVRPAYIISFMAHCVKLSFPGAAHTVVGNLNIKKVIWQEWQSFIEEWWPAGRTWGQVVGFTYIYDKCCTFLSHFQPSSATFAQLKIGPPPE